jgi:hypothetical protein
VPVCEPQVPPLSPHPGPGVRLEISFAQYARRRAQCWPRPAARRTAQPRCRAAVGPRSPARQAHTRRRSSRSAALLLLSAARGAAAAAGAPPRRRPGTASPAAASEEPVVAERIELARATAVALGEGERRAAEHPLVAARLRRGDRGGVHADCRESIGSPWIGAAVTWECGTRCGVASFV